MPAQSQAKIIDALNRLLQILYRSLPHYLSDAAPWSPPDQAGVEKARALLANIVVDQELYAGKVADAILARGGRLDMGEYPMLFTDTHDLALDFMLGELVYCQRQDVAAIGECLKQLAADPKGKVLAEECLGNARGHLQSLQELVLETKLINAG